VPSSSTVRSACLLTLLELVVTLAVIAIVASAALTYVGTAFERSADPAVRLETTQSLHAVMASVNHAHGTTYATDLAGLSAAIGSEGSDQSNAYGSYHVVRNRYIKFTGGVEADIVAGVDPETLLKVTLSNALNETVTMLFAE